MSEDRTPDEAAAEETEPEPMNRAERRAQARGKKLQQANHPGAQGFSPKGGSSAHTQRNWANRKSG